MIKNKRCFFKFRVLSRWQIAGNVTWCEFFSSVTCPVPSPVIYLTEHLRVKYTYVYILDLIYYIDILYIDIYILFPTLLALSCQPYLFHSYFILKLEPQKCKLSINLNPHRTVKFSAHWLNFYWKELNLDWIFEADSIMDI